MGLSFATQIKQIISFNTVRVQLIIIVKSLLAFIIHSTYIVISNGIGYKYCLWY